MKLHFTKMHGIGNDYIYFNCMEEELADPGAVSRAMAPRHFSVGGDGVVMICRSDVADAKMRMFNLDGSEGRMCGNAIRCVGKYLYDNGIVDKTSLTIETLSGIKTLELFLKDGKVDTVSVDMGVADFSPSAIPIAAEEEYINHMVVVDGQKWHLTTLSMGNPHAVTYVADVDALDLDKMGPHFENHPLFPERVNTEFVEVLGRRTLKMRVYERGSGETWACGTGACATVAASARNGIVPFDEPITVKLVGGELSIVCKKDYRIIMTGSATKVYDGVYEYED